MKLETQTQKQKLVIYCKGAGLFPIRHETISNTKVITQRQSGGYLQTVVTESFALPSTDKHVTCILYQTSPC